MADAREAWHVAYTGLECRLAFYSNFSSCWIPMVGNDEMQGDCRLPPKLVSRSVVERNTPFIKGSPVGRKF